MPQRVPVQQFSFTAGQLDDSLAARADIDRYFKGGLEITNFLLLSHGGLERRGGLEYVAEIPTAATGVRLASFEFSTEQAYLHVFTDLNIAVYMNGVKQADITTPWAAADLDALDWTQSLDTMLIAHVDNQQQKLVRTGSHTSWALTAIALTNLPTYRFSDPTTNTGTPSAVTGAGITFTAGGNEFASGDVGKYILGNQGKAIITAYTSATVVTVTVEQDFKDTTAIDGGDWTLEEAAWSTARGWPGSVALYQGRSYYAGAKELLQTSWGSQSAGDLFSFKDTWEALDDEAVSATLEGESVNAVKRVVGLDSLFMFTTGGVFAVTDSPVTPAKYVPIKQTAIPSADIRPVEIEDALVYIAADESGKATTLHELSENPDSTKTRYVAQDLSLMSSSILNAPVDMAARKGRPDATSASHVFVVNGDGSVGVMHSRRREQVLGWTKWQSQGNAGTDKILRVAVVAGTVYFLVERTINSVVRYFIEKLNTAAFFDSSVIQTTGTAKSVWTGFNHLIGETVKVWADGALRDDAVVDGSGQVTVTDGGAALNVSAMEAGLPFSWAAETMPLEAQISKGTLVGETHKLAKATVRVKNGYDLTVNGRNQSFRSMRGMVTDASLSAFSGLKSVRFLGWNRKSDRAITVRMTGELPITIESATATVAQ